MGPKPPSKGSKGGAKSSKLGSKPASKPKTPYKPKKRDEVKAKRPSSTTDQNKKKKTRTYTDKELNIPKLNMITPAGVQKPKGKKKGKIFVDDQDSMMTILAMVNADKEGQIESKMIRQRQMEEIREARQKEMEKRKAMKDGKLEETKNSLRKSRKRKSETDAASTNTSANATSKNDAGSKKSKKKVSFG